ncbi:hypothetical protein EGW08_004852 [Elysia chlorotica]|uniref:Uncharacterized protein n=1 Tax=Elysia chlorotica TaxID=188477 RepID=A0A433U0X4_ELYCH|nr:hypothetical protein EGW08_004852 [Elysia chlorotica]
MERKLYDQLIKCEQTSNPCNTNYLFHRYLQSVSSVFFIFSINQFASLITSLSFNNSYLLSTQPPCFLQSPVVFASVGGLSGYSVSIFITPGRLNGNIIHLRSLSLVTHFLSARRGEIRSN